VDAVAAVDALGLVDHADAVLVIVDGTDRAGSLAGSDQVGDGTVRAGLGAHAAFLTLLGIDMRSVLSDSDGAETAGIQAGFAHAQTAVVGYGIGGQRTLFAGCTDDLDDVLGIRMIGCGKCACKTDPFPYDLPLFIDAAAVGRQRSGNDLIDKSFLGLVVEIVFIGQCGRSFHDPVLETKQRLIVCYHIRSSGKILE
jgi:hypothetical protein